MTKEKVNEGCKVIKDKYNKLTLNQKLGASLGVGFSLGVVLGLILNRRK